MNIATTLAFLVIYLINLAVLKNEQFANDLTKLIVLSVFVFIAAFLLIASDLLKFTKGRTFMDYRKIKDEDELPVNKLQLYCLAGFLFAILMISVSVAMLTILLDISVRYSVLYGDTNFSTVAVPIGFLSFVYGMFAPMLETRLIMMLLGVRSSKRNEQYRGYVNAFVRFTNKLLYK